MTEPAKVEESKDAKQEESALSIDSTQKEVENKDEVKTAIEKEKGSVKEHRERENWKGPLDFLISLVAYAVGFGNIWRFPYLCYRHGGGTFLVVYAVFFVTLAVPAFFLEVVIGQYTGLGATEVWKIAPIFKGVGIASLVLNFMVTAFYHVLISWSGLYFYSSMQETLPWEECRTNLSTSILLLNSTLEQACRTIQGDGRQFCYPLATNYSTVQYLSTHCGKLQSSAQHYFFEEVLHDSRDVFNLRGINKDLVTILVLVEIAIYFCIRGGLTKARVFVWFSAIFPYIMIIAMVIRGCMLPGALEGIKFYIIPRDWRSIFKIDVWKDAGTQVCFSYSIGFGALASLGAYNKFNHNAYRDSILTCFINGGTSILAGFAVFSVLGHLAHLNGVEVKDVVQQGPGLAFIAYPEVITRVPPKQLWSVCFFIMMIFLGLDTQVCMVESFYASIEDKFHFLHKHKQIGVFGLISVLFLFGLVMCTHAGNYYILMFDNYGASGVSVLFVVFCEVVAIIYSFGINRLRSAIEHMLGFKPGWYWIITWRFVTPMILFGVFVASCVLAESQKYEHNNEEWPLGARLMGHGLSMCSALCIPGYAVYFILYKMRGLPWKERFKKGFTASSDFNAKRIDKFIAESEMQASLAAAETENKDSKMKESKEVETNTAKSE